MGIFIFDSITSTPFKEYSEESFIYACSRLRSGQYHPPPYTAHTALQLSRGAPCGYCLGGGGDPLAHSNSDMPLLSRYPQDVYQQLSESRLLQYHSPPPSAHSYAHDSVS